MYGRGNYITGVTALVIIAVVLVHEQMASPSYGRIGTGKEIRLAIVEPTFTAAAYNNAFYSLYSYGSGLERAMHKFPARCGDITHDPCVNKFSAVLPPEIAAYSVGTIPSSTDVIHVVNYQVNGISHPTPLTLDGTRFGAYTVVRILPHLQQLASTKVPGSSVEVIDDRIVHSFSSGSALRERYDVLLLGHQEYVTQKEYDNLKEFVQVGGVLICLDGNLFYAEVEWNPALPDDVQFLNGHQFGFNKITRTFYDGYALERWANETAGWLGSNYFSRPFVYVKQLPTLFPQTGKWKPLNYAFANNPFNYSSHEEQRITNFADVKQIFDYRQVWKPQQGADLSSMTSPPPKAIIATYYKDFGLGRIIVFGIYADELISKSNPAFLKFFDEVLLRYAKFSVAGYGQVSMIPGHTSSYYPSMNLASLTQDRRIASDEVNFSDQGSVLLNAGKGNESIPYFDKALAINPNPFDALYQKGAALLGLKEYGESIPYFDKALAINPNFYPVLYNKGFDLLVLGKYNDSIPYFDKAILKKPDYSFPLIGKGIALVKLGKYSESIPIFDKALAINPKDINALNYKKLAVAASNKK